MFEIILKQEVQYLLIELLACQFSLLLCEWDEQTCHFNAVEVKMIYQMAQSLLWPYLSTLSFMMSAEASSTAVRLSSSRDIAIIKLIHTKYKSKHKIKKSHINHNSNQIIKSEGLIQVQHTTVVKTVKPQELSCIVIETMLTCALKLENVSIQPYFSRIS